MNKHLHTVASVGFLFTLYSTYFMSRGPIGNVLMQMSYEPLWTICVVYLRPIKLCAIFFHIIHLYFSSVQKLTDMNNAIVNFDKLMMHIFAFSLCFVSRLSYCVSINV